MSEVSLLARGAKLEKLLELGSRRQTYKSHQHARRAFLKWVCRHQLYERLIPIKDLAGRVYYERCGGGGFNYGAPFRSGYPCFDAPRSEARRQWNAEYLPHYYQWVLESRELNKWGCTPEIRELKARWAQQDADEARPFFEMTAAMGKIDEHVTHTGEG